MYSQLEVITARMLGGFVPKAGGTVVQLGGGTRELYYYPMTVRQVTVVGEDVNPSKPILPRRHGRSVIRYCVAAQTWYTYNNIGCSRRVREFDTHSLALIASSHNHVMRWHAAFLACVHVCIMHALGSIATIMSSTVSTCCIPFVCICSHHVRPQTSTTRTTIIASTNHRKFVAIGTLPNHTFTCIHYRMVLP
jgi:hypothetical protein